MIINLMKLCWSSDEVNKIEYEKLGNKPNVGCKCWYEARTDEKFVKYQIVITIFNQRGEVIITQHKQLYIFEQFCYNLLLKK